MTKRSWFKRLLLVVLFLGLPASLWWLSHQYGIGPVTLAKKVLARIGMQDSPIREALNNGPRYPDYQMDGWPRPGHPKILIPELNGWDGHGISLVMQTRKEERERLRQANKNTTNYFSCYDKGLLGSTVCWVRGGDKNQQQADEAGRHALQVLREFTITVPDENPAQYGDTWEFALAYDLLTLHPEFTPQDRALARAKLRHAARVHLSRLEDDSPSLWHGRSTLAANAWLSAIMLDPDRREDYQLMRKAQAHFMATLRSMSLSEGWPEGYNYWVNNRGMPLMLASAAYINGLDNAQHAEAVRQVVERVGLWHLYLTRPDHRVEGVGDEASRIDLKDDTRRIIDVIVQLTRNRALAAFSNYIGEIYPRQSYYIAYHAQFALYQDPTVIPYKRKESKSLAGLGPHLKDAELFGKDAMNQLLIHNGWGKDSTFISFSAAASLVHHGHYDAGHFTLFKRKPLATNSGTYGEYTSPHRLNYSIRTVAKNSLLILRPGEEVSGNGHLKDKVSDGGQRVTLPTGSAIQSVEDWISKQDSGPHLRGGKINGFSQVKGQYVYANADLTRAYNSTYYDDNGGDGKVSQVQRELLYLTEEDTLIIHDRVVSTRPEYTKKWLLHSINKPEVANTRVLKGSESAGILESDSAHALIQNGDAYLQVTRVYPQDAKMRIIGGEGYRYYVEADGDDSDLDGINMIKGERPGPWFDPAAWRIEIQPGMPRKQDHFLVALTPGLDVPPLASIQPVELVPDLARGLNTGESFVIFIDKGLSELTVTPNNTQTLYLAGLPANTLVTLDRDGEQTQSLSDEAGLLQAPLNAASSTQIKLSW